MKAQLNHMIVWCKEKASSSEFFAYMLGRPAPQRSYDMVRLDFDNTVSFYFLEKEGEVAMRHYAFLIEEGF